MPAHTGRGPGALTLDMARDTVATRGPGLLQSTTVPLPPGDMRTQAADVGMGDPWVEAAAATHVLMEAFSDGGSPAAGAQYSCGARCGVWGAGKGGVEGRVGRGRSLKVHPST
jgi:hypothetical protein